MDNDENLEALKALDELIDYEPKYPLSYENKAIVLYNLDSLDECLRFCDKASKVIGETETQWHLRGLVNQKRNDFNKALECFDESLRIDPAGEAMVDKAKLFHKQKRKEEAYKTIKSYAFMHPKDEDSWRLVADIYYMNNDLDSAQYYVEKSLSIKRTHKNALALKGSIFYKKDDFKNAIKYLKKANDGTIGSFYELTALAEIFIICDKYDESLDYLADLEKMKLDEKQKIQFLYLKLIADCLTNKNFNADQMAFNNLLKTKHKCSWNFSKTDAWLAKATLTQPQRTFIEGITKQFKEYVGPKE